jgi:hypothetical protein
VWGVETFTEAGYTIRLVIKTRPATQFRIMRELRVRLLHTFEDRGIVLPGDHWGREHLPEDGRGREDPSPNGAAPDRPGPTAANAAAEAAGGGSDEEA